MAVALRKESVDRNLLGLLFQNNIFLSLSARRAWIEIAVDSASGTLSESLSARRAWIEIIDYIIDYATDAVALRKESVDRNEPSTTRRLTNIMSLSARRAWIEMT